MFLSLGNIASKFDLIKVSFVIFNSLHLYYSDLALSILNWRVLDTMFVSDLAISEKNLYICPR